MSPILEAFADSPDILSLRTRRRTVHRLSAGSGGGGDCMEMTQTRIGSGQGGVLKGARMLEFKSKARLKGDGPVERTVQRGGPNAMSLQRRALVVVALLFVAVFALAEIQHRYLVSTEVRAVCSDGHYVPNFRGYPPEIVEPIVEELIAIHLGDIAAMEELPLRKWPNYPFLNRRVRAFNAIDIAASVSTRARDYVKAHCERPRHAENIETCPRDAEMPQEPV